MDSEIKPVLDLVGTEVKDDTRWEFYGKIANHIQDSITYCIYDKIWFEVVGRFLGDLVEQIKVKER